MANQATLQKLMETVKVSKTFEGFSEADLQIACDSFVDRSDEDVEKAIENIIEGDEKLIAEEEVKKNAVVSSQQVLINTQNAEMVEHQRESVEAEELLKKLFN